MSSHDMAAPPMGYVGQATRIEQSRAVAEVQAAITMAKQCPRNVQAAIGAMREACGLKALADRAFYSYSRGGSKVTGPTIHLARELARIWGNLQYGVTELSRDVAAGQSEVLAYAWDLEANTRIANVFIVPHLRDARGEKNPLLELRDVYENNANNGARRVREAILSSLPTWFVDEAKTICTRTINDGGGLPLPRRVANALELFVQIGVTSDRIERQIGRVADKWTARDLADLTITYQSIQRNETDPDTEFPRVVTAVEVLESAQSAVRPEPAPVASSEQQPAVWPEARKPGSGARP